MFIAGIGCMIDLLEVERVVKRINQHQACLDKIDWTTYDRSCAEFYNQVEYTTNEIKKLESYLLIYLRGICHESK